MTATLGLRFGIGTAPSARAVCRITLYYILEWVQESGQCKFQILPVELRFTEVTRLRITLDYAAWSLALGPFSISVIERRTEVRERYTAQLWLIKLNSPEGKISFEAAGFEQIGNRNPKLSSNQYLSPTERTSAK